MRLGLHFLGQVAGGYSSNLRREHNELVRLDDAPFRLHSRFPSSPSILQ